MKAIVEQFDDVNGVAWLVSCPKTWKNSAYIYSFLYPGRTIFFLISKALEFLDGKCKEHRHEI